MPRTIDAPTLKTWLSDNREIAVVDVREAGQFGEAHLFFAIPAPYSRFEVSIGGLVPNLDARLILCDGGDGVAERAAQRAVALGYRNVHVLAGGVNSWRSAGYTLYAGVNVPSKTFGELVEHAQHTPRVSAQELQAMRDAGENLVIVDGRTYAEFNRMSIPGGISCPNGELPLRIGNIAPDPTTKIVVNCAGRTRSIIGAQTLIDFGVPNPVFALENGTQGWFLAGLQLENGASRKGSASINSANVTTMKTRARSLAQSRDVEFIAASTVHTWLSDHSRTTYLLDVRTPEEFEAKSVQGFIHAPGGQLVQATDHWVAVRGARIVLIDDEMVRAPVTAGWLRQLGYEAFVLDGGVEAASGHSWQRPVIRQEWPAPKPITAQELASAIADNAPNVIDLRPSMTFRKEHIAQAVWSTRARIAAASADPAKPVVLVSDEAQGRVARRARSHPSRLS